jgi:hypothetical protein
VPRCGVALGRAVAPPAPRQRLRDPTDALGEVASGDVDPLDLLRLLLDPGRLAIAGMLAREPATLDDLAASTGRSRAEVVRTLAPLVQGGVVTRDGERYRVDEVALRAIAGRLPQALPPSPRVAFGMTADEAEVLGRFFSGDRLTELPSQRSKRLVVLERLALEFEPGRRYAEPEVNELLRRFHDDYATLRRALVDERLLDRAGGEYWRSGGRIV